MISVRSIFIRGFACLAATSFLLSASYKAAADNMFDKIEIDQSQIIAIATPLRQKYALTVIEQLAEEPLCWTETSSSNPVIVILDLLAFDFRGICGRTTDSNGHSIRMADEDLGLDYKLEVLNREGNLFLVGIPYSPNFPELIIGQAYGISGEAMKIVLNPGWRLTKRSFEGKTLGHYYFTHDQSPELMETTEEDVENIEMETTEEDLEYLEIETTEEDLEYLDPVDSDDE